MCINIRMCNASTTSDERNEHCNENTTPDERRILQCKHNLGRMRRTLSDKQSRTILRDKHDRQTQ